MGEIFGVSHPIPTEFAKRIYKDNKTVFIGKRALNKVSKGDKFIIYESQGAQAYTGWADIVEIGKQKTDSIIRNYGKSLMLNPSEFKKYAKSRPIMNVIEFENFVKFKNPVKPRRFVGIGGKYIYKDEFEMIDMKRG